MEIRTLLHQLLSRWWLIVPVFLIALGSSLVFTIAQRPVYESTSTLLVNPAGAFEDALSAVGTLSRQPEIAETYAQVANSRTIRRQAVESLGLSFQEQNDVRLDARLVPGANILRLAVRSTDAGLAARYNAAIHDALVDYTRNLGEAFRLDTLDEANTAAAPVAPNVPANIALGFAVSVSLAIGLGIASELLAPGQRPRANLEMLDADSIAFSAPFFMLRLRQEMSRTKRSRSTLVVALMNMNHGGVLQSVAPMARRDALRRLAGMLDSHLRVEDISARIGPDLFALLLPDTTEADAVSMIEALRRRMSVPAIEIEGGGRQIHVQPAAGLVTYGGEATSADDLLEQAQRALRDAETIPVGKTQAFSTLRPA
ncbi:MAG: diguanylate cyclase domain-containing protein [Candidatus Limnocylindria bacterium]